MSISFDTISPPTSKVILVDNIGNETGLGHGILVIVMPVLRKILIKQTSYSTSNLVTNCNTEVPQKLHALICL